MILQLFRTEPVVAIGTTLGAVDAVILVLIAFGVPVTHDQKVAIDGAVSAVLGLVAMVAIRSQVSPVASLPAPSGPAKATR